VTRSVCRSEHAGRPRLRGFTAEGGPFRRESDTVGDTEKDGEAIGRGEIDGRRIAIPSHPREPFLDLRREGGHGLACEEETRGVSRFGLRIADRRRCLERREQVPSRSRSIEEAESARRCHGG
jgi:hypothetical protein